MTTIHKFVQLDELKNRKFEHLIADLSDSDNSILAELADYAIEEVKTYLKGRYDTDFIFAQQGIKRNPLVKRLVYDYLICFLYERTSSSEIPEALKERCNKNTTFLEKVASGEISPELPTKDKSQPGLIRFIGGSETKFNDTSYV